MSRARRVRELLDEVYSNSNGREHSERRASMVLEHYRGKENVLIEVLEDIVATKRTPRDQAADRPFQSLVDSSSSFYSVETEPEPDYREAVYGVGEEEGVEIELGKGADLHYYAADKSDVMRRIKNKVKLRAGSLRSAGSRGRARSFERVRSLGRVSNIGTIGSLFEKNDRKMKSTDVVMCITLSDVFANVDAFDDNEDASSFDLPLEMIEVESVSTPKRKRKFRSNVKGSPLSMKTAEIISDECEGSSEGSFFVKHLARVRTFEDSVVSRLSHARSIDSAPGLGVAELETPEGVLKFVGMPAEEILCDDQVFPDTHSVVSFVSAPPSDPITSGLIPSRDDDECIKAKRKINFNAISFRLRRIGAKGENRKDR